MCPAVVLVHATVLSAIVTLAETNVGVRKPLAFIGSGRADEGAGVENGMRPSTFDNDV